MAPKRGFCVSVGVGDLFQWSSDSHALAHCVGADMLMTAGIAVSFRQRFGNVQNLLGQGKVPGQVAVLSADLAGRRAPVFYLVTKHLSHDYAPTWEHFVACLEELAKLCKDMDVKTVSMPQIGAGLDHLNWDDVYRALVAAFKSTTTRVFVFKHNPYAFCPKVQEQEPKYRGYQLIGDSQMVRYSTRYASYHQHPRQSKPKALGLCVSGQTVHGLSLQVSKSNVCPTVICLIGTNDVLSLQRAADEDKVRINKHHDY